MHVGNRKFVQERKFTNLDFVSAAPVLRCQSVWGRRRWIDDASSASFVDFAAVADVVEVETALIQIKLVQHPVIADAQLVFGTTGQALVGKRGQSGSHFIYLALDIFTDGKRQGVECPCESGRPDLEGSRHELFGLAGGVVAGSDLAPRLVELGLNVVSQFEAIFEIFIEPVAKLFQFGTSEPGDGGFDFLHGAHGVNLSKDQ